MTPNVLGRWIAGALLIFAVIVAASSGTYTVQPGYRGVQVTLGRVSPDAKPEGFGFKLPLVTRIYLRSIRQEKASFSAECYSSDLQQVKIRVSVLYRVPPASVVPLFHEYQTDDPAQRALAGDPFVSLIEPRVAEAIKEITAQRTAEQIVRKREEVKIQTLQVARSKVTDLLLVEDIVLEDIGLTRELEFAIEQKMVQEQEAAKARFKQQQAQVEANTLVIKARGEAESINLRGRALRENPSFIDLQIVEQWDGVPPLVVGPRAAGTDMILPIGDMNAFTRQPPAP
jgi:prohibitin 2